MRGDQPAKADSQENASGTFLSRRDFLLMLPTDWTHENLGREEPFDVVHEGQPVSAQSKVEETGDGLEWWKGRYCKVEEEEFQKRERGVSVNVWKDVYIH